MYRHREMLVRMKLKNTRGHVQQPASVDAPTMLSDYYSRSAQVVNIRPFVQLSLHSPHMPQRCVVRARYIHRRHRRDEPTWTPHGMASSEGQICSVSSVRKVSCRPSPESHRRSNCLPSMEDVCAGYGSLVKRILRSSMVVKWPENSCPCSENAHATMAAFSCSLRRFGSRICTMPECGAGRCC